MPKAITHAIQSEIIPNLDVRLEYEEMGLEFSGPTRDSGKAPCYGFGREVPGASKPSGWVDTLTGVYGDSGSGEKPLSIFDFAVQKAKKFPDFKAALEYFAGRAGVDIGKGKKASEPSDKLEFQEWDTGNLRLLEQWCAIHKPGTSADAVLRAGGRCARYPTYINRKTGERRGGQNKVIALPCYGRKLNAAPPVAWQIYEIGGGKVEHYQGKNDPPSLLKVCSIGPTSGTLMNLEAVTHLAAGLRTEAMVIKTGGPTDMLAAMTAVPLIPPESQGIYVVTSNASGEGGGVPPWSAELFSGRKVAVVHDRDEAGTKGGEKWAKALSEFAREVKAPQLPYTIRNKDGLDLRDFLNGRNDDGSYGATRSLLDLVSLYHQTEPARGLPSVTLPGGSASINTAADSLGKLLDATGRFFCRGGAVMRAERDDETALKLGIVKPAAACSDFERVATLRKYRRTKDGDEELVPATCSEPTARLITEAASFKAVLSPINVLTNCPVLLARGGALVQVAGYDRESGTLASGTAAPEIPLNEAIKMLNGLFADFRFASPGDRARAMAAVITPALVFGGLLGGRAPIDVGEADKSQTGKGFRNKLTTAIYNAMPRAVTQRTTGGVGSVQETFDKSLIAGATFIAFDNFRGKIDFPGLESFCTEDTYSARAPYMSPVEIDPRRVILMMTSNRAEMTVDLANRSSCVRLLKQSDGHHFQSYPEGDLLDHVRANQHRYLGAVFAVIREWFRRGSPVLPLTAHDFRQWARVLGWIVSEILGAGDLLEGHRAVQDRLASPGLNWLRDIAQAVQSANGLGQWLRAHHILQIALDHGVETAGIDLDVADEGESWHKATLCIGRRLGRMVKNDDELTIDNYRIERGKIPDADFREKTGYRFALVSPQCGPNTPPIEPPMETREPPIAPIDSEDINARTRAHTRAHAYAEFPGIGGIGGVLGGAERASCVDHDWIDVADGERVKVCCRNCRKFYGYKSAGDRSHPAATA